MKQADMKKFFGFKGRMRRRDYLLWISGVWVTITLAIGLLALTRPPLIVIAGLLGPLLHLGVWLLLAQAVKRLHDFDQSGWWILLFLPAAFANALPAAFAERFVPFPLDAILMLPALGLNLVLWFKRGTVGENQYGSDPIDPIELSNAQYRTHSGRGVE
jgi:uncharacterized membrane protein YhaH (DUF805 family)